MNTKLKSELRDGEMCEVVAGTHKGKSGAVRDLHTSKTGHVTITVEQSNGVRFKTLARNVVVKKKGKSS
ncbi:MAG: KOW motif-containing protein [Thermoanaerobaculia bacterium]